MLSGDSTVRSFSFDGKKVVFVFEDNETDQHYQFEIQTPLIFSETPNGIDCVHIRLEDSTGFLDIDSQSGRFILPPSFSKQMQKTKKGLHILVGLKAKEYPMLFSLVSYDYLLRCPIKSEEDIKYVPISA
ncbi:MAG: hypothetical protein AAF490_28610 [Chloroflexota bacterium]